MKITDILAEGPNDPNIFKAIFLAGGPGSGKSYVSGKLLKGTGMRVLNSDDIYEYMMTKAGMALDPETIFSPAGQETREKAKEITKRKQESHIDGRLGMIIDGTGKDVEKYAKMKQKLEDLGYDTMMLFVNTSLDVAQERNLQRPRSLDPKVVKKMWDAVQQNIMSFQQLFGAKDFYVIDNSGGLEDPSRQGNFTKVQKAIDRFINTPPRRPAARQWLAAQKPGGAVKEDITPSQLNALEAAIDRVFGTLGIDVEFTRHFLDRVNDERNVKPITIRELGQLFAKEYKRWGRAISSMPIDAQAVMKDLSSDINIPFVLNKDGQEKELVAKTVMRKKNFRTPNRELPVESVNKGLDSTAKAVNGRNVKPGVSEAVSNQVIRNMAKNPLEVVKDFHSRDEAEDAAKKLKDSGHKTKIKEIEVGSKHQSIKKYRLYKTSSISEAQPVMSATEGDSEFEFQGRNRGVSTWESNDGIVVQLNTWTDYKKTGSGNRLRDPGGTKWKLQIRENGREVFYKVVGKAEFEEAKPRKQRAVKAALKFLAKEYGIDAYNQLWIEGGLPKPAENVNEQEETQPELTRNKRITIKTINGTELQAKIVKRRGNTIYANIFDDYKRLRKVYKINLDNLAAANVAEITLRGGVSEADANEANDDTKEFVRQFSREKRKEGWSVYVSRTAFRGENDYMLEFEKDGYEFSIIGDDNRWELFYGPTPGGRGEQFDGIDAAFQTATA